MHFSSDLASEAASELHSSRLVTPPSAAERDLKDLKGLAGLGGTPFRASEAHRLPKSGRYVSTGWGEVKAQKPRNIEVFSVPARALGPPSCAGAAPREFVSRVLMRWSRTMRAGRERPRCGRARQPVSPAAPPPAAPSCHRRLCFAPAPAAPRLRRPCPLATRRSDRSCAGSRAGARSR